MNSRVHLLLGYHQPRWYDVSAATSTDPAYVRRFAGHVEHGTVGLSDPAMRTV